MTARHLQTADDCQGDVDSNCGQHRDDEARDAAFHRRGFEGAVLAGLILPAGVEHEVTC